jgi:hypothetical protein
MLAGYIIVSQLALYHIWVGYILPMDFATYLCFLGILSFRVSIRCNWIASHNFSNSKFVFDHAYLLLLTLIPIPIVQWIGILAFVDDYIQHYKIQHHDPNYVGPLHILGRKLKLYQLREWISQKTGWSWLNRL